MTVVYLDSVFLLNGIMDYLMFLSAATLAGLPLRRGRYILAALLGGTYAAAVFLPGLGGLASLPAKAAAGILLGVTAFGGEERFGRLMLLTFAVACGMAGCILGLSLLADVHIPMIGGIFYTDVNASTLLLASTAVYLVLQVAFRASARHGIRKELLSVRICIRGRRQELTALLDSGNCLRSPMDGRPVLVVAPGVVEPLLDSKVASLLSHGALRQPAALLEQMMIQTPELHPQLLPYRAVGTAGGLLLMIRSDWAEIGGRRYENQLLALSPTELGDGYRALWGGETRRQI